MLRNFLTAIALVIASPNGNATINHLSESDIEQFHTQGYLVVRNMYSPEEITEISQCTARLHAYSETLFSYVQEHEDHLKASCSYAIPNFGEFFISNITDAVYHLDYLETRFILGKTPNQTMAIQRIMWAGAAEPALLEQSHKSKLLTPVSQLLRSDQADHLINQIHPKNPRDGVGFFWHQDVNFRFLLDPDWRDVNGTGSYVQTIIAIDPMSRDNGGLRLVKGLFPDRYLDAMSNDERTLKIAELEETAAYLNLNPGDVVFIHPNNIHGSECNTSDISRRVLINGFSSPDANHVTYPGTGSGMHVRLNSAI